MRKKNEDTKIRIYEYINEYIKNNRVSPTINEIASRARENRQSLFAQKT